MRVLDAVLCLGLAAVPVAAAAQAAPAAPAAVNAAFVPQPILQGGEIFVLFPPGSPFLKADRVAEPEQNTMSRTVPGRVSSIVNIHNPTIELHRVETAIKHRRRGDPGCGRRAQHVERRHRGGGLRAVLLSITV